MKWQNCGIVLLYDPHIFWTCSVGRRKVLFLRDLFVEGCAVTDEFDAAADEVQTVLHVLPRRMFGFGLCFGQGVRNENNGQIEALEASWWDVGHEGNDFYM